MKKYTLTPLDYQMIMQELEDRSDCERYEEHQDEHLDYTINGLSVYVDYNETSRVYESCGDGYYTPSEEFVRTRIEVTAISLVDNENGEETQVQDVDFCQLTSTFERAYAS